MFISRTGGVIAAASKKEAVPLLQIGSITIIKRTVLSFQQAGIFPIVIITGTDEFEVKSHLANYDVIFLHNDDFEAPPLFDSVKIGLNYLKDKCERVMFVPVNVPMFSPATLKLLMDAQGDMITPRYNGAGGHPVLISSNIIPEILEYSGDNGLRGAAAALGNRRVWVDTNDEGILHSIHNAEQLKANLEKHNNDLMHSFVSVNLAKEFSFFNSRTELLLFLIMDTNSVKTACEMMALSFGKAWDMLNKLEKQLGYQVVYRRHGGSHGGRTALTDKGLAFLIAYHQFESNIFKYAQSEFETQFYTNHIL
ncbi:MAG: NTP transferase domain-containing protein [Oscillospiraceae bacterium]|nr:NTP transferase domain-containing protein [Oscillospiraceae bacterium]